MSKDPVTSQRSRAGPTLSWQDPDTRAVAYQVLVVGLIGLLAWYLVSNTMLDREAGFAIGESLIDYTPSDTYRRAILVGLVNTLRVSAVALVFATVLGLVVGISRLSSNGVIRRAAAAYVGCVRNVP